MKQLLLSLLVLLSISEGYAQRNTSYKVKEGENVEHIAKIYRVSPNDIFKLNPDARRGVEKGSMLVIPDFGVTYYSKQKPIGFKYHTVQKQETLFGLTHVYNITIDDIKRYNQSLYSEGLRAGEEITIPLFKEDVTVVEKGRPGLKKYVVKPGEGLWRIAKNHGISQQVLMSVNEGISENLKEGQEIWVPSAETKNKRNREGMVLYHAEKGEGFMSLERKFGLSKAELIALNPELKHGLKLNSEIWIPKDHFQQIKNEQPDSDNQDQEIAFEHVNSNESLLNNTKTRNVRNITYILPFNLKNRKDYNFSDLKKKLEDDKLSQVASDFYLGAKIAIDSLSKLGYKFKVQVFDSESSESGVQRVLNSKKLGDSQVIIGPFLPKVFNVLSRNITNSDTALLVPVSNSSSIELRPNVYQTIPNTEYQRSAIIDFVKKLDNVNVLVVADTKNRTRMQTVANTIPKAHFLTSTRSGSLKSLMSSSKENIVIFDSNDLIFLSELIRNLHALQTNKHSSTKIRLVALEKGSVFDEGRLSNTQLSNLHFTYPTVNRFFNGENNFFNQYKKKYGVLPNRYVVRGFDMTMDAVLRLGINPDFKNASKELEETSQVENKFIYKPNFSRGGGYENRGVFIVEYNDLEEKELR